MAGLLILKQMFNKSDETIVEKWKQNPYYQYFTGCIHFEWLCHATHRTWFISAKEWVKKAFEPFLMLAYSCIKQRLTRPQR